MKPKVSIIVPIYNVDQYLRRCLESLVNQSFKEIEILCINDGSTDGSQAIVDDYAKCYPNIVKSFVKLNGGLSDARNYGLDCAQGEFIAFVDSDDWIELTMIEEMYKVIIEQSADIAVCDLQYIYDTQRKQYVSGGDFEEESIISNPNIIKINNSAWNKLYKSSLFDDVRFPKGLWYEDLGCVPILLAKANKVVKINKIFYNYFQREGSIMHTHSEKIFDIYKAIDLIQDYVQHFNIPCLKEVKSLYVEHGAKLTTIKIKDYQENREKLLIKNFLFLQQRYPKWIKDPIIKSYSTKEKIVLYLLAFKQYKILLALYDWKWKNE